jgi:hypothetical protein
LNIFQYTSGAIICFSEPLLGLKRDQMRKAAGEPVMMTGALLSINFHMSEIKKSILVTLAYFNRLKYPLTLPELARWIFYPKKLSSFQLERELKGVELKEKVSTKNGFYFLKEKEWLVDSRAEKYIIAQKKFKKALRIAKLLSCSPFIKGIAVSNSLSYNNASRNSDIDFAIIASRRRIWLARFLAVAPLKIFSLRPTEEDQEDKFCLSFFITEEEMDVRKLMINDCGEWPDIHFIYWLASFVPLYDQGKYWLNFYQANSWIKGYLGNFYPCVPTSRRSIRHSAVLEKVKRLGEGIHSGIPGDFLESLHRWMQLKIMPESLKREAENPGSRVVISENILKFHLNDRREFYRSEFLEELKRRGI